MRGRWNEKPLTNISCAASKKRIKAKGKTNRHFKETTLVPGLSQTKAKTGFSRFRKKSPHKKRKRMAVAAPLKNQDEKRVIASERSERGNPLLSSRPLGER